MEIISAKEFEKLNNTALTIGKFDGFHKGHQKLLKELTKYKEKGMTTVVLTFNNAPREVIDKKITDYILTAKEKVDFLENRGVDYYIEYPCDDEVINTSADDFLKNVIIEKIGAKIIVCGTDFRFGKNRAGNVEMLRTYENKYNYKTIVLDKLQYNSEDISSSRIREAVQCGNMELVNELLGYNYTVIGEIVNGKRVGRTIGFPTANITPEKRKMLPPCGVYYTKCNIDGKKYKGVTNVGNRPTFEDGNIVNIETCFLGFEGDLYGRKLEIEFHKFIRPEMRFDSVDELKNQIQKDVKQVEEMS